MDSEKKMVLNWFLFGLVLLVLLGMVLSAMNYVGLFAGTVVERKVYETSFQYTEARKAEIATYEAQLAEIDKRLSLDMSNDVRADLEAQRSAIVVRLHAARERK